MTKSVSPEDERLASQPYTPMANVTADVRVANALDYIATQLGEINRKLDRRTDKVERVIVDPKGQLRT
jgi:hypothetical protein